MTLSPLLPITSFAILAQHIRQVVKYATDQGVNEFGCAPED
jgi:hypothetical protein